MPVKPFRGSRCPARPGFTLIEVIAAVAVLAVGLVAAFALFAQGTVVNQDSKETMAAFHAAQRQIEILRGQPFSNITTGTFTPAAPGLASPTGSITAQGGEPLKTVTVVVEWKERGGVGRRVALATTIAKGGIGAP